MYIYIVCVCDHIYCNPYRGEYTAGIYNWVIIWFLLATDCATGMLAYICRRDGAMVSQRQSNTCTGAIWRWPSLHQQTGHFEATKNREFIKKWMKHELI